MLLELLQNQTALSESQLMRFADNASKRYRVYTIPKRSGGVRVIEHPAKPVKAVQRWINSVLFSKLPVHQVATAYRAGSSIRDNALLHVKSSYTLRMDFKDFFPSFRELNIRKFLIDINESEKIGLTERDIEFVEKVACRNGRLTIGAPTSPILTNCMMYNFDQEISSMAAQSDLIVSRYADDLFISSTRPNQLFGVPYRVKELARGFAYADLSVNDEKTKFLSKKYRRAVTGLVLTPSGEVSLGRTRKRWIESNLYNWMNGRVPAYEEDHLKGWIAFAKDADPVFFERLVRRFGDGMKGIFASNSVAETSDPHF